MKITLAFLIYYTVCSRSNTLDRRFALEKKILEKNEGKSLKPSKTYTYYSTFLISVMFPLHYIHMYALMFQFLVERTFKVDDFSEKIPAKRGWIKRWVNLNLIRGEK